MNVSLSFNQLIINCLCEIKVEISSCQECLDITTQKIIEIENLQKSKNINDIELGLLVQKLNLLLIDNFCLISKQSKLIEYYTHLLTIMNHHTKKNLTISMNLSCEEDSWNELVEYYQCRGRNDVVSILKNHAINTFNDYQK